MIESTIEIIQAKRKDAQTKTGKPYAFVEVDYKEEGKAYTAKLMEFKNKDIFTKAAALVNGQIVVVSKEKNDAGYWDWVGITAPGAPLPGSVPPSEARVTPSLPPGSNKPAYIPDEKKQLLIVRQSCLKAAIEFLQYGPPPGTCFNLADVGRTSEALVDYVMNGALPKSLSEQSRATNNPFDDMDDDIPL